MSISTGVSNKHGDPFLERTFRFRTLVAFVCLLIILYCNLYWWLYIPYNAFQTQWRPDHALKVALVEPESVAAPFVQPGDTILAIDDRPVRPATLYFPPTPRATSYDLLIEREGRIVTETVPYLDAPDAYGLAIRVTPGILSLIAWLVGSIALHFSWRENRQATWLGYLFLLASVVVAGWTGALMGVPGMWILGQPLVFLLAVGWMYAGLLPQTDRLGRKTRLTLGALVGVAVALGLLAFLEGAWLFPRGTSLQQITGISMYQLSAASQAVAGAVMFGLVILRRVRERGRYVQQQLNILLVAIGLGFLPAVVFSFLPLALWGDAILPVQFAVIALVTVPLGYLYVIFRHAYLGLDGAFGRITPYALLIVLFSTLYGLTLYALNRRFGAALDLVLPAVLLFVVLAALAAPCARLVTWWVHALFFGRKPATPDQMTRFANELAHQPDAATLQRVVTDMCGVLGVPQAALSLKNGTKLLRPTATVGQPAWPAETDPAWLLDRPLVRTVQQRQGTLHPLFSAVPWAEAALPLRVREQTLGVWVLARPRDGYFNQADLAFLEHAAATLAMGSEIVVLLDSAETLSRQLISVQDDERRAFASQLHDQPLQRLAAVRMLLGQETRKLAAVDAPAAQRLGELSGYLSDLDLELRTVYENAFPRIVEYGVEATIETLAEQFRSQHALVIETDIVDLDAVDTAAGERLAQVVYRIVQEALNNVIKHADASRVAIHAACDGAEFQLAVIDDGRRRPETTTSMSDLLRRRHYGIAGMHAWARSVGGAVSVTGQQGGTRVAFTAPLARVA